MNSALLPKLLLAIVTMDYVMEVKENGLELSDMGEARFLKELISALGYGYDLKFPADGEYGRRSDNGSWSGLVGMLQRGEADVACSGLMMTEHRSRVVDFTTSYRGTPLSFAIGTPGERYSKYAYLHPFFLSVWGCFLATILAAGMLMSFVGKRPFGRVLFDLLGSVLRQPVQDRWHGRTYWIAWLVFALVMSSCYSGGLLSFLTVPLKKKGVETFRELATAVQEGTHRCYAQRGTNTASYLRNTEEDHLRLLGKAIEDHDWYYGTSDMGKHRVVRGDSAEITYEIELRFFYGLYSNVFIARDTISAVSIGIALRRNFCCKKKLNKLISRFTQAGLVEKYIGDASFLYWLSFLKLRQEKVNHNKKLSVEGISGALFVLYFGYAVSFVTFLGELLFTKQHDIVRNFKHVIGLFNFFKEYPLKLLP